MSISKLYNWNTVQKQIPVDNRKSIIIKLANIMRIITLICVNYILLDIFHTSDKWVYYQFISLLLFWSVSRIDVDVIMFVYLYFLINNVSNV